jgi:predicted RNA-binding protein
MTERKYWLDLFSGTTWKEYIDSGANISGFKKSRWPILQKIQIGDYLICYLTGVSRFIGVFEVVSEAFLDDSIIWKDNTFPARCKVKPVVMLTPETAIPVFELRNKLSFFENLTSPHAWTGHFRGSPALWKSNDGQAVVEAIIAAKDNPTIREVDPKKLAKRPQGLSSRTIGIVSVPEDDDEGLTENLKPEKKEDVSQSSDARPIEVRKHTEIEYLLLNLGNEMGFNVWVARNDKNREFLGRKFSEYFKLKDSLPLQFDDATLRTVELIDVLWLKGNAIVAAFEVESTTSIYSGLLRMSDLISMQPNINIPLYLVAPDERRKKVFEEINRPTFSRLNPPLAKVCRYISFDTLIENLQKVHGIVRYLKPEFLVGLSEDCDIKQ